MKNDQNGFAISGIIYSFIVLFLMILLLILMNLSSQKLILDKQKSDVLNDINKDLNSANVYKELVLNGAYPEVYTGLIPVVISNDGSLIVADITNEWYSYAKKNWANAVLIDTTSSTIKNKYFDGEMNIKEEIIGTPILESEIKSYFVWIPRFKYMIFNSEDSIISPNLINITFESKNVTKSVSNVVGDYLTHPSFSIGLRELNGFWVSKFEITGSNSSKPNIASLNSDIQTFYSIALDFNDLTNSHNSSSHIIKNEEWSAITYLAHSIYGINKEVAINTNSNKITGCGMVPGNELSTDICENAYGTNLYYDQSTTGNISGVFDMSGGSNELVFAALGTSSFDNLSNIDLPLSHYYTVFLTDETIPNSINACNIKCFGHSLFETKNWYSDNYEFVTTSNPWLLRGGSYNDQQKSGIFSYFATTNDNINSSTRVIFNKN